MKNSRDTEAGRGNIAPPPQITHRMAFSLPLINIIPKEDGYVVQVVKPLLHISEMRAGSLEEAQTVARRFERES